MNDPNKPRIIGVEPIDLPLYLARIAEMPGDALVEQLGFRNNNMIITDLSAASVSAALRDIGHRWPGGRWNKTALTDQNGFLEVDPGEDDGQQQRDNQFPYRLKEHEKAPVLTYVPILESRDRMRSKDRDAGKTALAARDAIAQLGRTALKENKFICIGSIDKHCREPEYDDSGFVYCGPVVHDPDEIFTIEYRTKWPPTGKPFSPHE